MLGLNKPQADHVPGGRSNNSATELETRKDIYSVPQKKKNENFYDEVIASTFIEFIALMDLIYMTFKLKHTISFFLFF